MPHVQKRQNQTTMDGCLHLLVFPAVVIFLPESVGGSVTRSQSHDALLWYSQYNAKSVVNVWSTLPR